MKRNVLKILVCVIALLQTLLGCSSPVKESTQYRTPLYSISVENGQYYLNPNAMPASVNTSHFLDHPKFSSVAEMRRSIISGTFTEANLYALSFSDKNEDGSIQICDLDKMFECTTPSNLSLTHILWYGKTYKFLFGGQSIVGGLTCCDEDEYTKRMDEDYLNYDKNYLVTLTGHEHISDRDATVYYYTTSNNTKTKHICYTIQAGNKQLTIQEKYRLETTVPLLETSASVPYSIELWGIENSGYFYGSIHNLTERPSVEWLSEFGITPYVDTSTS